MKSLRGGIWKDAEARRAYFREYWAKLPPEKKAAQAARKAAWAKAHRQERTAYQREWAKKNSASTKASAERSRAKFKETHPILQWEFTLKGGLKQYGRGRTVKRALAFMPWIKPGEIESVREYHPNGDSL